MDKAQDERGDPISGDEDMPPVPVAAPVTDSIEPSFTTLIGRGLLMLVGAAVAAWLILIAQTPNPFGGH